MHTRITFPISAGQKADLLAMSHDYANIFTDIGVTVDFENLTMTVDRELLSAKWGMEPVYSRKFALRFKTPYWRYYLTALPAVIGGVFLNPFIGFVGCAASLMGIASLLVYDTLCGVYQTYVQSSRRNMLRIYCQWLLTLASLNEINDIRELMRVTADRIKSREHMLRLFLGHDEYKRFLKTMDVYTTALNIFSE